jgi:hypothetical protein
MSFEDKRIRSYSPPLLDRSLVSRRKAMKRPASKRPTPAKNETKETRIGKLTFESGSPSAATITKLDHANDAWDFERGLNPSPIRPPAISSTRTSRRAATLPSMDLLRDHAKYPPHDNRQSDYRNQQYAQDHVDDDARDVDQREAEGGEPQHEDGKDDARYGARAAGD